MVENRLVIELILTILNRIKLDYTMGIKFLQLSKMNKNFLSVMHTLENLYF